MAKIEVRLGWNWFSAKIGVDFGFSAAESNGIETLIFGRQRRDTLVVGPLWRSG